MPSADRAEFERSERFAGVVVRRFERDVTYSTREYLDLLMSYWNHRALARVARAALLACIGELIDSAHGGRVTKRYMTELTVAHRSP